MRLFYLTERLYRNLEFCKISDNYTRRNLWNFEKACKFCERRENDGSQKGETEPFQAVRFTIRETDRVIYFTTSYFFLFFPPSVS